MRESIFTLRGSAPKVHPMFVELEAQRKSGMRVSIADFVCLRERLMGYFRGGS